MIRVGCLLLLFSVLDQTLATDCNVVPEVDGCHTRDGTEYKRRFTPACYKHDVCYACGADRSVGRYTCDGRFRTNMRALCYGNFMMCSIVAELYYEVARSYNRSLPLSPYHQDNLPFNYQEPSASWCNATWVDGCM